MRWSAPSDDAEASAAQARLVEALLGDRVAAEMRKLDALGRIRRRPNGRRWEIDFGRKLRARRIYSSDGQPFETRAAAERILLRIRRLVAENMRLEDAVAHALDRPGHESGVGPHLDRWLAVKREEAEAGDRSPTYVRELGRWVRDDGHIGAWWRDKPVTRLDLAGVREWARWLNQRRTRPTRKSERSRRLSGKTRWNVHGALHAFMAWLAEEDPRVKLPARWPWPARDEPAVPVISAETQDAILAAIPEARRGIFLAMALLGIRPGEAVALDVADYRDGWLTVSRARKGERLSSPIRGTKTRKPKRLPVPDELAAWIERHHPPASRLRGGALFRNPNAHHRDGRWSATALRRWWGKACEQVGVKVGIYVGTKHSMATHLLSRGVQERHIQALLGHADVRSTRRYAQLADGALVEALRRRSAKPR